MRQLFKAGIEPLVRVMETWLGAKVNDNQRTLLLFKEESLKQNKYRIATVVEGLAKFKFREFRASGIEPVTKSIGLWIRRRHAGNISHNGTSGNIGGTLNLDPNLHNVFTMYPESKMCPVFSPSVHCIASLHATAMCPYLSSGNMD
jgi:hypothetical protein